MRTLLGSLLAIALAVLSVAALATIDSSNPLPTVTAVTALAISFVNLYLSHFYGIHRTSCTQVAASYDGQTLTAHYAFENTGTFEEIILGATFVFPEKTPNSYSTLTFKSEHDFLPELGEPVVLKPKQVFLVKYAWKVDSTLLRTHFRLAPDAEYEHLVEIKVDFVHPILRRKASRRFACTSLKFYPTFVTLSKLFSERHELFKGEPDRI
jgi:hypothetical protein